MVHKLLVFYLVSCVQVSVSSMRDNDTTNINNLKIYGGHEIPIESAPFMVALYIPRTDDKAYFCGGSIIHRKFVLTAAHCFRDSVVPFSAWGYVGMTNLKDPFKVPIKLEKKFCHEGFTDNPVSKNDICILKLAEPLKFGPKVNKVMLPKEDSVAAAGTLVTVTGWGDTEKNGDSGGPLTYKGQQIGIVSLSPRKECTGKRGDVYTKVASFSKWIATVIRNNENV